MSPSSGSIRRSPHRCGPCRCGCAQAAKPPVVDGQELFTIGAPLREQKGIDGRNRQPRGAACHRRRLQSSRAGSAGGPVFTAGGGVVGITSIVDEKDESRRGVFRVVRIDDACEVVASAEKKMKDAAPPNGTHLPVEPARPFPVDALKDAAQRRAGSLSPYQMSSSDFDVAFITPVLIYGAQYQSEQTSRRERGRGTRTPDAEPTVVRPLMDFSNWSEYVADFPPVLLVRVTPKLVEGFWTTVARGAAQTQGVSLPPIKRVKSGFSRMRAFCGDAEVTPIHPFKLEQRVSESDAIYEGLYVFDPGALGPQCGTVKLVLYSEKEPEKGDTRAGRSEGAPADLAGLRTVSSSEVGTRLSGSCAFIAPEGSKHTNSAQEFRLEHPVHLSNNLPAQADPRKSRRRLLRSRTARSLALVAPHRAIYPVLRRVFGPRFFCETDRTRFTTTVPGVMSSRSWKGATEMNRRRATIIAGVVLALATANQSKGKADGQQTGTDHANAVRDGFVNFGSPQPQPVLSNQLVPNEVTINKGGTVTFRVNGGGHGIAIYPVSKNTTRDDITNQLCLHSADGLCVDTTFANGEHEIVDGKGKVVIVTGTSPPINRVDDPTDRLLATSTIVVEPNGTAVSGAFHTGTNAAGAAGTQIQYRFEKTGRFLVICMNRGHYLNDWMFGFVNVVDASGQAK